MSHTDSITVIAYIGLGSNLAAPVEQIKTARLAIAQLERVDDVAFSSLYGSPPMGPQDQPDYINAVMAIKTALPAMDLLRKLQAIENDQGRIRDERWGARTLDLDLLLYGEQQINLAELTVPHAGIAERAFVLYPLQEIAGNGLIVPGKGLLKDLLEQCPLAGLQRLSV